MAKYNEDDLFADTTMTFGEHLEELRIALGKAVLGLLIGFIAGFFIANPVVRWIQTPLKGALEEYYVRKSVADMESELARQGEKLTDSTRRFIEENHFVYEKVFLEASEIKRIGDLLEQHAAPSNPDAEKADSAAGPSESDGASPAGGKAGEPAGSDRVASQEVVVLGGRSLPPPQPTLVMTRIWRPINTVVQALSAHEAFMIWLKAAFVCGLLLASPYMFWKIWEFVAAGLYPHEKRYVYIYLPFSVGLFWTGAATAFFFVFQYVLRFLFSFNRTMNIDPDPRISEWLSFVLFLPLGFGIAYQLPLVMLFLHRIGIFSIQAYLDKWRIAVLVIFTLSMFLTPADPVSMLLMAMPLTALYFLGIGLCRWMPRQRSPFGEGYEP